MIGNTIEYIFHDWKYKTTGEKGELRKGIVVDAFTEVKGSVRGKSEYFLGIGEGHISGTTDSVRIYRVQFYKEWDREKKFVEFNDIHIWQLKKIISFANDPKQEVNEEKIIKS